MLVECGALEISTLMAFLILYTTHRMLIFPPVSASSSSTTLLGSSLNDGIKEMRFISWSNTAVTLEKDYKFTLATSTSIDMKQQNSYDTALKLIDYSDHETVPIWLVSVRFCDRWNRFQRKWELGLRIY